MATPIYADHMASTPCAEAVAEAMAPWWREQPGNPHATTHMHGQAAAKAIAMAKGQIADLVDAEENEITITSGATESANLAIIGYLTKNTCARTWVSAETEHDAVRDCWAPATAMDRKTRWVTPNGAGEITPDALRECLGEDTKGGLVSIMLANNETGSINNVAELCRIAHENDCLMHCDASQAPARIEIKRALSEVDLITLSGHKIYGPKGIGALVHREASTEKIMRASRGGRQQHLRDGTIPTALVVGFAKACEMAGDHVARLSTTGDKALHAMQESLGDSWLTIDNDGNRMPGCATIRTPNIDGRTLAGAVAPKVSIGVGSACHGATTEASRTLKACGINDELANEFVRISFGIDNTEADGKACADALNKARKELEE